jgi:hypothetical protein
MSDAVDQDIQTLMLLADVIEHCSDFFRLRYVSGKVVAANLTRDFLGVLFMTRMHDDLCAFSSEATGNAQPNIVRRSRN